MTWSVAYESTWTSNADKHAFWVYFFDTFLDGRGNWSTNAHPSGQSYRRQVTKTMTNTNTGETGPQTWRYNINWVTTSPTTQSALWYVEDNYTSTPHDVGDATSRVVNNIGMPGMNSGKMKIWVSDLNVDNWFVTFDGKWQGCWIYGDSYSEYGNLSDIADWNAGNSPGTPYPGTIFGPGWGSSNMSGPPGTSSGTFLYLVPTVGAVNSSYWGYALEPRGGTVIYKDFSLIASSSQSQDSTNWLVSGGVGGDVGILATPLVTSSTKTYYSATSPPQVIYYNNSTYYVSNHSASSNMQLVFDCGTTEPFTN